MELRIRTSSDTSITRKKQGVGTARKAFATPYLDTRCITIRKFPEMAEITHEKAEDGRDGWEENEESNFPKPKRLEDAIVTYLVSLETQMASMRDDSDESKALFVENVLTEIKQSTASAACDRRTNTVVEKICYNATLPNVIEIMARLSNYAVFLARNRHASHVVQALLARLCSILKFTGIGDVEENVLVSTVLQFVRPIMNEITWLIKEQAASHVVRAILCLLAGIPIISEKKGKGSKHPHSVAFSEPLENVCDKEKFYISKDVTFDVPDDFHEALGVAVLSVVQLSVSELQDLVADWSGCAVLAIIIRVLCNPDIVMGGPELALRLFQGALDWKDDATHGAAVFYAMAADKAASYFLEATVECCDSSFFSTLCEKAVMGKSEEYAADGAANFVLQTVMRRLSRELQAVPSEEVSTLHSLGKALLKELTGKKTMRTLLKTRGGVVLWMLELARHTHRKGGREKEKKGWGAKLGQAVLKHWTRDSTDDEESGDEGEEDSRLASALAKLLAPRTSGDEPAGDADDGPSSLHESSGGKSRSDKDKKGKPTSPQESPIALLTGRLVGALMRTNELCVMEPLCRALSRLPSATFVRVALSGPLSKGLLDPLLAFSQDTSRDVFIIPLLTSLSAEQTMQLASHFIGQHLFRRFFEACGDIAVKETLVQALEASRAVVNKSKEGRASMKACHADMYRKQPEEWHALMKRQARANAMVVELSGTGTEERKKKKKKKKEEEEESGGEGEVEVEDEIETLFQASKDKDIREEKSGGNSSERPKTRPLDANYGPGKDKDKEGSAKKKKKRSGSQASRQAWFLKRQEMTAVKAASGGGSDKVKGKGSYRDGEAAGEKRKHSPAAGADFEKLAKLKSSKLGLDLNDAVSQLAKERAT